MKLLAIASKVLHFGARESPIFLASILVGLIISLLLFYPNARVHIGFRNIQKHGKVVPTVLLDFDTPTVYQMGQFKSLEEFEISIVAFASSRLDHDGIVKAGTPLTLTRVSDLLGSSPELVMTRTEQWSGLRRLFGHLWPPQRGFFMDSWGTILLPYALLILFRIARFALKARLHPSNVSF